MIVAFSVDNTLQFSFSFCSEEGIDISAILNRWNCHAGFGGTKRLLEHSPWATVAWNNKVPSACVAERKALRPGTGVGTVPRGMPTERACAPLRCITCVALPPFRSEHYSTAGFNQVGLLLF